MKPTLIGSTLVTRLAWQDDFTQDLSKWYQDTFTEPTPHRTGNKYLRADGTVDPNQPWSVVPGRWAGRYDKFRDYVHDMSQDSVLRMRGKAVRELNPYRESFKGQDGFYHPYSEWGLYAPWLTTAGFRNGPNGLEIDPDKTTLLIEKGSVIEVRVNLTKQIMRGARWNLWGMPAEGAAYTESLEKCEVDFPEVEGGSSFRDTAMMKCVGGKAGDTPNGAVNLALLDIDLREGWHTFTTLWNHNGTIAFYIDGVWVGAEERKVDMKMYLIMAFEYNSGVKAFDEAQSWENTANGAHRPVDPGLTAQSVILDVDLMDQHEVLVDYVRVFDILTVESEPTLAYTRELLPGPVDQELISLYSLDEDTVFILENYELITKRDIIKFTEYLIQANG